MQRQLRSQAAADQITSSKKHHNKRAAAEITGYQQKHSSNEIIGKGH
jgi:hypothetical protein